MAKVAIKVFLDKEKQKVVFAEAGKDFVDILFSFLTLPLGTIIRLLRENFESHPVEVGSLNSLYESVSNLETKHFATKICKDMLLNPRNSSEAYCQKLVVNVDATEPTKYFICSHWPISIDVLLSTYNAARCTCGKLMNTVADLEEPNVVSASNIEDGVFVSASTSFIITDDLHVMPDLLETSIELLNHLGIQDLKVLEETTLSVGSEEILELLKWSLLTKTPLTNMVLPKSHLSANPKHSCSADLSQVVDENTNCTEMTVKVLVQKSKKKVLYAQVEEDFINFLFSFLTIPLGRVISLLGGNSSIESLSNLYNSISSLNVGRCNLRSEDIRALLIRPKLALNFLCKNQILPIDEVSTKFYVRWLSDTPTTIYNKRQHASGDLLSVSLLDPKIPDNRTSRSCGFLTSPATFLVTDDLVVKPSSSVSTISELHKLNVPLGDVEVQVVSIDSEKAHGILRASLNSRSVLTDCMNLMILKKPKEEPV